MEETYSVEQLITGSYVKYNRLSELISTSYAGSSCEDINIYIDLYSVLKQLYSGNIWTYKSTSQFEIASCVINMCGHYREFFRHIGVNSTIYLIYGLNCPDTNNTYVKGYNSKFIGSYIKKPDVTKNIEDNLKILELICQYLPKIYFFNIGNCEVSSMIHYLMFNVKNNDKIVENIIISKDPLTFQLIPINARVLRPLKTKNGDESYIVDNTNLWDIYITQYRKTKQQNVDISTSFFSNVLSMTTVPERSMPSIFNTSKAISIISECIKNKYLQQGEFYTQSVLNTALTALGVECNTAELDMRYRAISSSYQSMFIIPIEKPMLRRLRLVDLEDVQSLKEIIAKYFIKNPIDIDRL